jgi:hypothetical protein
MVKVLLCARLSLIIIQVLELQSAIQRPTAKAS